MSLKKRNIEHLFITKFEIMVRSTFLSLNLRDLLKGLLMAVLSAVITYAYEAIQAGVVFDVEFLKSMGMVSLSTVLAYLLKNLLDNSQGQFLKKEE